MTHPNDRYEMPKLVVTIVDQELRVEFANDPSQQYHAWPRVPIGGRPVDLFIWDAYIIGQVTNY
jgi:hypothetical protein